MTRNERTHRSLSRIWPTALVALVLGAVTVGLLMQLVITPSSSAVAPAPDSQRPSSDFADDAAPGGAGPVSNSEADGFVPFGVNIFDDEYAGVSKLDAALLDAARQAARDASGEGFEFLVNSGWRSASLQQRLLDDAVTEYGSAEEAARWVARPDTSAHVTGDAVDIGPERSAAWLAERGSAYGLCQVYENEPWHFEFFTDAAARGCPSLYPDPSYDPRLK